MTKGLAIWEAYREFESAIVEAARVSPGSEVPACRKGCFQTDSKSLTSFAGLLRDGQSTAKSVADLEVDDCFLIH